MPQLLERNRLAASHAGGDRAVRILAKSLFRQLKESGFQNRDILSLSTELVGLITSDLRPSDADDALCTRGNLPCSNLAERDGLQYGRPNHAGVPVTATALSSLPSLSAPRASLIAVSWPVAPHSG